MLFILFVFPSTISEGVSLLIGKFQRINFFPKPGCCYFFPEYCYFFPNQDAVDYSIDFSPDYFRRSEFNNL
jgi:hypothetical protein